MRTYIRDKIHDCDQFAYAEVFEVSPSRPRQRKSKCKPTSEIQEKLNERHAKMYFEELIHRNFGNQDYIVHLTFDRPISDDQAKIEIKNYARRIKYAAKKAGLTQFKYVNITEYGKRGGKKHYHVFMSGGLSRDLVEKTWTTTCAYAGRANARVLQFDLKGVSGLTFYTTKDREGYRRWNSSKNLIKPPEKTNTGRISRRDVKEVIEHNDPRLLEYYYPGYEIVDFNMIQNDINGRAYVYLKMIKKDGWLYQSLTEKDWRFEAEAKRIAGKAGGAG
jgi:hypothetical protein